MPNATTIKIHSTPGAGAQCPPTRLGEALCVDSACSKRRMPTVAQITELISTDNELSAAINARISSALREYGGERFEERFESQAKRIGEIDAKIDTNARATQRLEDSTAGIVELMNSWAGAMKTIEATGKVLKPLTWIVGFFSALIGLWAALRGLRN